MISRRHFLSAGAIAGLSSCATANSLPTDTSQSILDSGVVPDDLIILFQGDSITDGGRRRDRYYANDSGGMGGGYVNMLVGQLLKSYPGQNMSIYNRGISGHKVFQLANRWNEDCLQLEPNVLSLMIGVNDFWHTLTNDYKGTIDVYKDDLSALLERTLQSNPDLKMIIGEPFAVEGGSAVAQFFDGKFDEYRYTSKEVAEQFGASFLPYHNIFKEASLVGGPKHWCPDGVHPSLAGCALMADKWMEAFVRLWN